MTRDFDQAPGLGDRSADRLVLPSRRVSRQQLAEAEIRAVEEPNYTPSTDALVLIAQVEEAIAGGQWDQPITQRRHRKQSGTHAHAMAAMAAGPLPVGKMTRKLAGDERGVVAVEAAIILPIVLVAMLGAFNYSLAMWEYSRLAFAVEGAARCRGIGLCTDAPTTVAYAAARFGLPDANFVLATDPCGALVSGNYSFSMITMFNPVQLSESACYPITP